MIDQSMLHHRYYGNDILDDVVNSKDKKYYGIYYATTVSNPSKTIIGAVRVRVHGILDGDGSSDIEDDMMPWAIPSPMISFRVPKKGTQLLVYFKEGDMYMPVYIAQSTDIGSHNPNKESGDRSSYPNSSCLFSDQKDFRISYDTPNNEYKMELPNGITYIIDNNGYIHYNVPAGIDGGKEYSVITEKSVDVWTARKLTGRGSKYINTSHSKVDLS